MHLNWFFIFSPPPLISCVHKTRRRTHVSQGLKCFCGKLRKLVTLTSKGKPTIAHFIFMCRMMLTCLFTKTHASCSFRTSSTQQHVEACRGSHTQQLYYSPVPQEHQQMHSKKKPAETTYNCVLIKCPGIQHGVHTCCPVPVL